MMSSMTNYALCNSMHVPLALARLGCPAGLRTWRQPATHRPAAAVLMRALSVHEGAQMDAQMDAPTEFVEVGVVGAPHGVRGEMKVQPLTDFPEERLGTPGSRWLRAPMPKIGRRRAPPPTEVELEYGRTTISKGNEVWIVKLEGVESPEEARLLRGHALLIPAEARAQLEDEDEFYVQDLVGLRVFLASSGEELGKVVDLFDGTGTHDVLRIQLLAAPPPVEQGEDGGSPAGPKYVLLPFVKALVPVVDVAAGRMEIAPPEGLLELASSPAPKQDRRESRGKRERRRERGGGKAAAASSGEGGQPAAAAGSEE